jgi:hypothetical protein
MENVVTFCGIHFENCATISYMSWLFGIFFPVLVFLVRCTGKKSGSPAPGNSSKAGKA